MRWNVPQALLRRGAPGDNFFLSCKGQRWGSSAANASCLPKSLFPCWMCSLSPGCFPLETKPFPQWVWAAGLRLWGAGHAPPLPWWGQAVPLSVWLLGYTQTEPCPCSVTHGAPHGTCSPPGASTAGPLLVTLSWVGASSIKGSWKHKTVPGFLLSRALKQWGQKSQGNSLFCRNPQCSRWLASVFRFIQNVGRSTNFGAHFCVGDALGLDAPNYDLCQT